MFRKILIATHGTAGARHAEGYAIGLARALRAELHGLYVIHEGWSSLVGIEWLHSSHVRMDFFRYAESQLYQRANEVLETFRNRAQDICSTISVKVGEPTEVIAAEARELQADLIVVGGVASVRSEEYQARISLKKLIKLAPCPVLLTADNRCEMQEERSEKEVLVSNQDLV